MSYGNSFKLLLNKEAFHEVQADQTSADVLDNYRTGLAEDFRTKLLPYKASLEEKRRENLEKLSNYIYIAIAVTAAIIGLAIFGTIYFGVMHDFVYAVSILIILGTWFWAYSPSREYNSHIKEEVFNKVIQFLGPDYEYVSNGGFLRPKVESADIIPSYDRWNPEDYIKGTYQDVRIEVEEAELTETRGSGKNRRTVTKFDGLMVLVEMNKNFNGKTSVHADSGKIGNWLTNKFKKDENVSLEDPQFEKEFEVYSTDQVEARYLLTTAFMERLVALKNHFETLGKAKGNFQCSFFDDKLFLTIPCGKNMFEPRPIYESPLQVKEVVSLLEEMNLIYKLIDILKLNMKIGL